MLRIKELREDNDIKQKKIAELLGIQQNSYSQIENEKNTIQVDHLIKLAKFYKDFFLYQWNKIPDKWLKYNPSAESLDSYGSCYDGEDNNYNGLIDKEEPACKEFRW